MRALDNILRVFALLDGPPDSGDTSCLALSYQGTYGGQSLYLPTYDCAVEYDMNDGDLRVIPPGTTELVWVHEMALEESLLEQFKTEELANPWEWMDTHLRDYMPPMPQGEERHDIEVDSPQDVFDAPSIHDVFVQLVYRTPTASLLAFHGFSSTAFGFDAILSPIHKATLIQYPFETALPVPSDDRARVRTLLADLKYDEAVAGLVHNLSVAQMHNDVTYLTGEAPDSPLLSRHSFHPDARKAAFWILEQIESTGAACELSPFLQGFAPNVICHFASTEETDAIVLLSAHYDSRGSFGSPRAPGGDDDGSGTTAILAIARAIGRTGVTFRSNVELCLFAGEEQGLLGSKAYARKLREANANITVMIQADMLAYHVPGEALQLGLPYSVGTPEVAQLVANISALYSPELEVGYTTACCSDHQSFHEQGFAATQVFERAGPIADPMYHNSGDLSNRIGFDLEQVKSIAKVQFATLLHAAGFDLPE